MSNIKLCFYGSDFSPIRDAHFECFIDGKKAIFFGTEKTGIRGRLFRLSSDKGQQSELLNTLLEKAQENIDQFLIDSSLESEDKQIFTYINQQKYFGGLVGVISVDNFLLEGNRNYCVDLSLQINTRFDAISFDKKEEDKPYFLMALLFDGFVPLSNSKVNSDNRGLTDMLLLSSFIEKYKEAYVKGYFKTYHSFQNNDTKIKGTIDISRHIKSNIGINNGKIAYNFKEKTESNYINHLTITAYEQLKKKYFRQTIEAFESDYHLKQSLESLKFLINYPQYSKKTLISKNQNILSHPYFTEYEGLRKICLKILREEKVSIFNGTNKEKIDGVLCYVPRLWEKYITKHLRNINCKAQEKIKVFNINSEENYQQLTQPDFVFYNDNIPFMILDAKFKPGWLNIATTGKIGNLLLSDYDKCIRDMVSINSHATGVIFPTNELISPDDYSFKKSENKFEYKHNISKFNTKDKFYTFPIFIPKPEGTFITWKKQFIENFTHSFGIIKKIIKENR